DNRDGNVYQF
nr:Chain B, DNRDGNVYQF peptide [synthetic construct]